MDNISLSRLPAFSLFFFFYSPADNCELRQKILSAHKPMAPRLSPDDTNMLMVDQNFQNVMLFLLFTRFFFCGREREREKGKQTKKGASLIL